jgi:SNF2 family DNA or RNA helicase
LFQENPKAFAFLLSLGDSEVTGINLTAADHVFVLQSTDSMQALEEQAIRRVYRLVSTSNF